MKMDRSLVLGRSSRLAGPRQRIAAAPRLAVRCLIALLAIACAGEVRATQNAVTWSGGGGANNNWSSAANWSSPSGTAPNLQDYGNQQVIPTFGLAAGGTSNNNIASGTIRNMIFSSGAGAFTLTGSGLAINNAAGIANNSTATQTINLQSITLNQTPVFAATSGELVIGSSIRNGSGSTFSMTGTRVTLTGSSSYTGLATVTSGALRVTNSNALGTTAAGVDVATGAALELSGGIAIGAEALAILGTGISNGGALRNISGTNTWGGTLTLGGATQINSDAGELILNVASGNAIAGTNDNLTFGGAGDITINDPISNSTATLTKAGAGILTLAASNTYSGITTGSAGWIRATSSTNALGQGTLSLAGGNLELANDTGLAFGRNTTVFTSGTIRSDRLTSGTGVTHSLGTLSIGAQTLTVETDATVTSGTAGLTFGAVTGTGAATFIVNRTASANTLLTLGAVTTTNLGITVGGSGDTNITGIVGLGTGGLTKTGTGVLTLSAVNTYTGAPNISAGTLAISSTNNLGNGTSPVLLGDALNEGTLSYSGTSGPFTRGFTIGAGGGQLDVTRSGTTLTVSGTGNITGTGLFTVGGLGNVTVSSTISGISGLTMAGSGTLTLSATNRFGGTTTVNSGVLRLGNGSALSGSNAVIVAGGTLDNGGFTNSVASFTITGGVFSGTGTLTAGAYSLQGGTITANLGSGTIATAASTTLSATSAASVVQVNAGTLTLSTANLLSAAPVVTGSAGATLALGGSQTVGSIAGGAGLSLGANTLTTGGSNTSTTLSGDVTGSGNLVKVGSGTFTLSGNSSYSGTTSINAGAVSVASVAAGAVNQALGTGNTLNLGVSGSSSGQLVYTGGSGTLSKNVFALGNGSDTIQNAGSGPLALSGTLTKNGTILRLQGGAQGITVTGQITGTSPNSDLAVQNGLTTLLTSNTYNGPTFINSNGTLALGINNAIPAGSALTIGGTFAGGNGGPGTLDMGSFTNTIGSLAFSGSGGTIRMAPTASATSTVVLSVSGAAVLNGASSTLDLTGMANAAGLYRLLAYSTRTGTFGTVTGLDPNYVLRYDSVTANELDAQRKADQAAVFTMTASSTRALVNTSVTVSGTVTNSTPTGGTNLAVSLSSGGPLTANGLSSGTSSLAPQASTTVSGSIQAGSTAGTFGWSVLNTDANAIQATSTATGSLTVVNERTFTTSTGTLSLGFVHQGGAFSTPSLTVTSTGLNAVTENATVGGFTGGAAGFTLGRTSGTNVFNGLVSPQQAVYTLTGSTASLGAITGTYSSTVTREFSSPTSISVAVTGQVYSGQSTWATTTSGSYSWGSTTGSGGNAFGLNWGTNQGSPGLDAGFTTTDTATFGSALTSGTAKIYIEGVNPSLRSVTFANSTGSYEIYPLAGGSRITLANSGTNAAAITVSSGSHAIHTEVTLGSASTIDVSSNALFSLHGVVSGSNGLSKTGLGVLDVYGNSTYTGATDILQGTLNLRAGSSPLGGGVVTVYGGATLDLNSLTIANTINVLSGGILANTGSSTAFNFNNFVQFTGTTNGTINVNAGGLGDFQGVVNQAVVTVNAGGTSQFQNSVTNLATINVNAGGVATLSSTMDGFVTTSGQTTFNGPVLETVSVNGGVATFNAGTGVDSTVNVTSGLAIYSGTVAGIAHVTTGTALTSTGTAIFNGSVASTASIEIETGGVAKIQGGGSFLAAAVSNDGSLIVDRTAALQVAANISGTGSLLKTGSGVLELLGANTFSGPTSLDGGTLLVNGSLASGVNSLAGTTLGGSGSIGGTLSGVGLVSPGNSPGILTAGAFDGSTGLDAAFEFTGAAPVYGNSSASVNDVLRLTGADPFLGTSLAAGNVIDVYLNVGTVGYLDEFEGGFYSEQLTAEQLLAAVENATYLGWVSTAGPGTRTFNGINYDPIYLTPDLSGIKVTTKAGPAPGSSVTVFIAVPEPGTLALAGLGVLALACRRGLRRSSFTLRSRS